MEYKLSSYFHSFSKNGDYVIFNTLYGHADQIAYDLYYKITHKLFNQIDESILSQLLKNSYIVKNQSECLHQIRELEKRYHDELDHYGTVYFSFSYQCNLQCTYCFERETNKKKTLSNDDVLEVLSNIKKSKMKVKEIVLYGGEPLLPNNQSNIKIVLEYAYFNDINVRIITNGVNLPIYYDLLSKYKSILKQILVTIDGMENTHNLTRVFYDGSGTFSSIVNGIEKVDEIGIPLALRINIGRSNHQDLDEILLSRLFRKYSSYVFLVENNLELDSIVDNLSDDEQATAILRAYKLSCINHKIHIGEPFIKRLIQVLFSEEYVYPAFDNCGLESIYLFDANKEVYCCTEAGENDKFKRGRIDNFESYKYKRRPTFLDNELCQNCSISPICGGGCALSRKKSDNGDCLIRKRQTRIIDLFLESLIS